MYFWKDKEGKKISFKEFLSRFKEGIKNITPVQKIQNELISSLISLSGSILCLIALIIFREKLLVNWFAYGLILIFVGTIYSNLIKSIGLYQQKRVFKQIENTINGVEEVEEQCINSKIA
jgi:hypothetical protein